MAWPLLFLASDSSCDLRVDGEGVSRQHARLMFDGARVVVEDLGSTNGTYLDGVRLGGLMPLRYGQQLQIGQGFIEIAPWLKSQEVQAASPGNDTEASGGKDHLARHHYETGPVVARGGMGAIREAEDVCLRRTVAMKVMLAGKQASPEAALRFEREARVLAQLEHPNIVPIHDLGIDEQGQVFYTMKFVKGVTLKEVMAQIKAGHAETIARRPLSQLLTIFQKVCDAVSFAHAKGVIHRDLKPDNIMLGDFGEVLVMDWGLAKLLGRSSPSSTSESALYRSVGDEGNNEQDDGGADQHFHPLPIAQEAEAIQTMEGSIMGTPDFMSPEQAEGRVGEIDARTDIFALGGILYNLLTLSPPVSGANLHEVLEKIKLGQITPPSMFNKMAAAPARSGTPTGEQTIVLPHCPGRRFISKRWR